MSCVHDFELSNKTRLPFFFPHWNIKSKQWPKGYTSRSTSLKLAFSNNSNLEVCRTDEIWNPNIQWMKTVIVKIKSKEKKLKRKRKPFLLIFLGLGSGAAWKRGGGRGSVPSTALVGRRAAPGSSRVAMRNRGWRVPSSAGIGRRAWHTATATAIATHKSQFSSFANTNYCYQSIKNPIHYSVATSFAYPHQFSSLCLAPPINFLSLFFNFFRK